MSKDPHQMVAAVIEAAGQKAADAYQTVQDGSAWIRQVLLPTGGADQGDTWNEPTR